MNDNKLLCANCYSMTNYTIKTKRVSKEIDGRTYSYIRQYGECDSCHSEIYVPGLEEINHTTLNNTYRIENGIITIDEIKSIMEKYDIDMRPLSLVLGLVEITIKRYIDGRVPSRRYSDLLKQVFRDPLLLKYYLEINRDRITDTAYIKSSSKIDLMIFNDSYDSKIQLVSCYIRDSEYEITNMSLQKILYYTQAFSLLINNKVMFNEPCQAWKHGPVYPAVYEHYKRCGASIINHCDILINYDELLSTEDRNVINFVLHSFGKYNGSVLRNLTHNEEPWMNERINYNESDICTNEISVESIKDYFNKMNLQYNLTTEQGVETYINTQIQAARF